MTGAVSRWGDGIEAAAAADADRADTLRRLADSLGDVAERAEAHAIVAGRIDAGLASVHEAGHFEEAVHSLTAAAHLLTVRLGGTAPHPVPASAGSSAVSPLRRAA